MLFRYFDIVRDVRQNKGSILKASVEYIKKLKTDQERRTFLEEKCRLQEYQNKKLLVPEKEAPPGAYSSTIPGCKALSSAPRIIPSSGVPNTSQKLGVPKILSSISSFSHRYCQAGINFP